MRSTLIILLSLLLNLSAFALDTKISQSQAIVVELHDPSGKTDVRSIRVRDFDSKKMAQISLKRQRANPRVWDGFFVIQFFKGDTAPRTLEFYGVDKNPYFAYVTSGTNIQKISLFNSSDEMARFIAKDVEAKASDIQAKATANKAEVVSPVKMAQIEKQVREQVRVQEQAQISIEEQQAKKRADLLEQQEKLSQAEKQKKKEKASVLVKEADVLYQNQDYKGANRLYSDATELDPENDSYFYRYGVTLYKMDDYNKSLATFSIAEVPADKTLERDYYIALNHLKLKDYDKARKEFVEIREENDPAISPTASFFAGTIEYQQQKFPEARKSMEYVLDNSNDPQMDKAADDMLEQIDRMENFIASKKERYRFSFFIGPVYDQNVLNLASNNIATDVQAYRVNYGASALGVWYRTPTSDLGTQLAVSDYYSTNTKFQGDATLQTADPLEFTLTIPYHKEFATKERSLSWELLPTMKSIYMAPTGGTREEVIRSVGLSTTLATPIKRDLYLSGKLEAFSDTSYLATSSSDDDQTGNKYGITITPTKLLDLKGEKSISADVSYLVNNSEGKNYRYNRMGLGVSYGFPTFWRSNSVVRLDYGSQNYGEASTSRTDTTIALTGILTKELTKNWNLATTLQYTNANSEVEFYKYNKFMVMGVFTYTLSILDK
ncbi:tetratricopeptide repeat protein [Bdellovibrio sp. HCB-110]|uniref:tetratricopeptide repeat protein n=1 Tax=Bdellovibrio sp. HCB-110 TaxID=3391182 RepID=UPI0039B40090